MKRRIALAGLLAASVAPATAGDYLPPPDVALRALAAQPDVRAAAAQAQATAADGRALAVGSYEWEATLIPQRRTLDGGAGSYQEWEAQVMRRVRLPGKAGLDREIARHADMAAALRSDDATLQAARRLASAWMRWLRSTLVAREAQAQQALVAQARDALARRVALGDAARRELDRLEAEAAQVRADALAAAAEALAARQALATGFPGLPVPEQPPALPEPVALPGGADYWRERIVTRSHEIGIADQDALRQDRVAARARAERRPDPGIGLRVMEDRGGAERAVGLVVSMPLGYRHRSEVAQREDALALAARADADGMRATVEREARETTQAAEARLAQWQALQAAAAAQAVATTRTRRAWELGEAPLGEWLLAQRDAHAARIAEARARVDALEAALMVQVDSHALWHDDDAEAGGMPHG
jgi:outer membrane protein TolC